MWPHVCAFMHMCMESVCSYAFWLADPIALAVMCWVLLNWFLEQNNERMHRGKETKLEGWWTGLLTWCFINTTQPPPFLHFALSPLLYFKLNKWFFTHPCGLKITGLSIGMDFQQKPMILGLLEKDVKLFMGQALESCKEGIRCRVPLCLLYLTAEQRRSAGSHRTAHKCLSLQPCALKADACCDLLTV